MDDFHVLLFLTIRTILEHKFKVNNSQKPLGLKIDDIWDPNDNRVARFNFLEFSDPQLRSTASWTQT